VGGAREGTPVDGEHGLEPQSRAVAEDEPFGDLGRRGLDRPLEQPACGVTATAQAVAEAGACANAVHKNRVLGNERPAATAGDDQVLGGQRGDGLAHGVAVHAEAFGELTLGGQSRPRCPRTADDLATQFLRDEPPGGISAGRPAPRHHVETPPATPSGDLAPPAGGEVA
jgi:hypothetical protein